MSLLDGLIAQVAQSALQGNGQAGMNSGLGGMLGNVLGGQNQMGMQNNGFGMDDVLGGVLGGAMGNNMGMNSGMGGMGGGMGSILGSILGGGLGNGMGGQRMGGGQGMLMAALMPLALSFIQRNGGLSGALNKITGMGHTQQANSWMSADQSNMPLDPSAVHQLFDPNELQQVADQTGMDTNEVASGMANLLPQVFDNLTPNGDTGTEEQANNEISQILSQLNSAQ